MAENDPAIDAEPVIAPPLPDNRPPHHRVKEEIKAEPLEDEEEEEAAQAAEDTVVPGAAALDPSMQDTLVMEDAAAWSEPRITKALSQDSGPQSLLSSPEVKASWKPLPDPEKILAKPSTCEGPDAKPSTCEGPDAKPSTSDGLRNPEPPSLEESQKHPATGSKDCMHACIQLEYFQKPRSSPAVVAGAT